MAEICVSSHHGTLSELLADAEFRALAGREGFLIELRLDRYSDLSAASLSLALQTLGAHKLVVTYRSSQEGGAQPDVSHAERGRYLVQAVRGSAAYVDVEWSTLASEKLLTNVLRTVLHGAPSRLILSLHDFSGVPPYAQLHQFRLNAEAAGAELVKIAVSPKTIDAALPLLELMREETPWKKPLLALGMGEAGFWTRVLGPLFPHAAPFTFARGEGASGTAPGQPTWRELEELYRFRSLRPGWAVYGVIGNPIAHSLSPLLHNSGLAALGLDGVYVPFQVEGDPCEFVRRMAPLLGVRGLSVTIPHKEAVLAACSEIEPLARQIGAANTLVRRDAKGSSTWRASNTDAQAAAESLAEALGGAGTLSGRVVLILGAGGAARAVAWGVKALGAEVWICNRTPARAEKLAHEVGGRCVLEVELRGGGLRVDALVNTTPVGMHPQVEGSPLEERELPEGGLIFDTVYNPLRTRLLRLAEKCGLETLGGLAMFVGQGAVQFERFTGRAAPRAVMEAAVRKALAERAGGKRLGEAL